jgi:hypothetical protein
MQLAWNGKNIRRSDAEVEPHVVACVDRLSHVFYGLPPRGIYEKIVVY